MYFFLIVNCLDQGIYEISPALQNGAISLVLEENTDSKLLFQQVSIGIEVLESLPRQCTIYQFCTLQIRHFRNTQWWTVLDAGNGKWQIINDRTNLCLASRG